MSPVSQVRDPGHVTKVTRFGPLLLTGGLLEAEDGERSFVKELKSFAEFSVCLLSVHFCWSGLS